MSDLNVHLVAIQAGDRDAFARWLTGAETPLRLSLRRFARYMDTEVVMQETLLRVWQVAWRCVPDGKPDSLLRLAVRIARNHAIDEKRRMRPGSIDDLPPDIPELIDTAAPPDPFFASRVRKCLEQLPGQPRASILARLEAAGGQPDKSLAAALGMNLNTFLQNITRARRLIAECLRRHGIEVPRMNARDGDLLIEAALTAWRPRAPDGRILPHPAWADLSPEDRERVYEETLLSRSLEQGLDPGGVSTTVKRVLARLNGEQ